MISVFDFLRDLDFASVAFRMAISFLCGGLIGIEREYKRRSAGFRTHILICLGAAITTLTSHYLCLELGYYTDMTRLGAQVIAGIGFIGAGSILVTRRQRVQGLTTAAGLWTSAIIGLCFGSGFYEGGLAATMLILVTEIFLSRVEHAVLNRCPEISVYIEYTNKTVLEKMLRLIQDEHISVLNMEIVRNPASENSNAGVLLLLRLPRRTASENIIGKIKALKQVVSLEMI